jgi:hypothetical protein
MSANIIDLDQERKDRLRKKLQILKKDEAFMDKIEEIHQLIIACGSRSPLPNDHTLFDGQKITDVSEYYRLMSDLRNSIKYDEEEEEETVEVMEKIVRKGYGFIFEIES